MSAEHGRRTRNFRRLRANLRAQHLPCWICKQPIDYTLPPGDPQAFQPDHYYPVATHPHMAEDPANLRASHAECNKRRGIQPAETATWLTSAQW